LRLRQSKDLSIGLSLIAMLSAACARATLAWKLSRKRSVEIQILFFAEGVEVRASGKRLFIEPNVLRYRTNRLLNIPQIVQGDREVLGDDPGVFEYRFADPTGDPPAGLIHAFLVRCCIRARKELHMSQLRTLNVAILPSFEHERGRHTLMREVLRGDMVSFGIHLVVVDS
jgi:hypothetical protein